MTRTADIPAGTDLLPGSIRACLFDMDGVLTETATVHAAGQAVALRRHGADVVVADLADLLAPS